MSTNSKLHYFFLTFIIIFNDNISYELEKVAVLGSLAPCVS